MTIELQTYFYGYDIAPPPQPNTRTAPYRGDGKGGAVQYNWVGLRVARPNYNKAVQHLYASSPPVIRNHLLFITLDTVLATLNGCRYEPRRQHSCVERVDQQNADHKSFQLFSP